MAIPAGYIGRSDHAPAIRELWTMPTARREWRVVCREDGIKITNPVYSDPTADCVKPEKPEVSTHSLCELCAKPFVRTRPTARFCSPQCRFKASKLRKKGASL